MRQPGLLLGAAGQLQRRQRPELWQPFARLVLEAAYEATLLAGVINAARPGGSN